ncbi:MAG: hypothetical protein KDN05_17455, partial [Verrucomicrobiae bacterium]|nr:hypothetical protein [Verrucomicrobiae bacterium]
IFRQAVAENDMAIVWVSPAFDSLFRADQGGGEVFNAMMQALAYQSGYTELVWAPIIPIGHSAMASYPYQFAAWNPDRTLAAISIKGIFPDFRNKGDFDFDNARLSGIPLLFISGEFEDADGRSGKAASFRKKYPQVPLTMVADAGAGHFDFHDRLARYMALYLRKVAQYRLPASSPLSGKVELRAIDPTKTGWLYDRFRREAMPRAVPGSLEKYVGPADESFWAFDEELAKATDAYALQYRLLPPQLVTYMQNGEAQPIDPKNHMGVALKLAPQSDGVSFKIDGTFLDAVPDGGASTKLSPGTPLGHSGNGVPIDVEVITGPLKKTSAGTFAVQFGRVGFDNGKRSGGICLQATHDDGGDFKRAVQQAGLNIPIRNTSGKPQTITFPPIQDQRIGIASLELDAKSSAGVPVSYYVREGPAEVDGRTLKFTKLPPRARTPVKVTVVAYQWGTLNGDRLQSAEPVEHSFELLAPGQNATSAAQREKSDAVLAKIWEKAAENIAALPGLTSATTGQSDFGRAISFNFASKNGLNQDESAGAIVPVAHWNNITDTTGGKRIELRNPLDSAGETSRVSMQLFAGATAASPNVIDLNPDASTTHGNSRLYNGVIDQANGETTMIAVFGIPYERYDIVFYRMDDGPQRAGRFQVNNRVLYVRGGKGNPSAAGDNLTTVSDATCGNGSDIEQGNVVRFENLVGDRFMASFETVFAGDKVQRNKVAGFQIIERK